MNSSLVPLPTEGDAFGQVLSDCWKSDARPGVAFEIVERDDGYIQANDAAGYFAAPEGWSPVERWGCDQAGDRVLDVGCGAGRHAVALQTARRDVVGVDPSPGAVAVARARGVHAIEGTVRDLPPDSGPFDTIMLMGGNLGLIDEGDSGREFLARLADLAAPGALLIGAGLDPYVTSVPEQLAYHERNRGRGRGRQGMRAFVSVIARTSRHGSTTCTGLRLNSPRPSRRHRGLSETPNGMARSTARRSSCVPRQDRMTRAQQSEYSPTPAVKRTLGNID